MTETVRHPLNAITPEAPHIVHAGLDESGSLSAATPWFAMAVIATARPKEIDNLIARVTLRSGKRLQRERKLHAELKWHNASERVRRDVLAHLAQTDVDIFTLAVRKDERRIADSPENYAILACELLQTCWRRFPDLALALDRHFTAPRHIAVGDTAIYRHWPADGLLSIVHVDSERNALAQLADFVAGSVYEWHKAGNQTIRLIDNRVRAAVVDDWPKIKARWIHMP